MIYKCIDGPKDGQELNITQVELKLGQKIYFPIPVPLPEGVKLEDIIALPSEKEIYEMTDIGELTFKGYG